MDINKLCKGCFRELPETGKVCPYCGFDERQYEQERKPEVLPLNTVLRGAFIVGKCIGIGGFGITYIGWHINLSAVVAIKEFFPAGVVSRDTINAPTPGSTSISLVNSGFIQDYDKALQGFIKEAKILWRLNLPGVVRVHDCFEENHTAYFVMDYIQGQSLSQFLKQSGGKLQENHVLEMMHPVIISLRSLHDKGIIHRDISPENLLLEKNGSITLVDFGASRMMSAFEEGESGIRSMTVILKPGYAPIEQYNSHGNQGPWTDVYALCATMYKMLTGRVPENASTRADRVDDEKMLHDELERVHISQHTTEALLKGLKLRSGSRYQNMQELERALYSEDKGRKNTGTPANYTKRPQKKDERTKNFGTGGQEGGPSRKKPDKRIVIAAIGGVFLLLVVMIGLTVSMRNRKEALVELAQRESQEESQRASEAESQEASEKASEAESQAASEKASEVESQAASEKASEAESQEASEKASEAESQEASEKEAKTAAGKVEVGDIIELGSYEQDNDTSNGKEAIEWKVLDVEGEKALVISKYGLESRAYHEDHTKVTWETCELRNWLNTTFYKEAFSENERKKIVETTVKAEDNEKYEIKAGNDTADKIFLLSISEAEDLFEDNEARKCCPTEYAKGQGAYKYTEIGTCWWWLRSPGHNSMNTADVSNAGTVSYYGNMGDNVYDFVRPAMWISFDGDATDASEYPKQMKTIASLNIRQSPSTEADILGVIQEDTTITVIEDAGDGWAHIIYGDTGIDGYVRFEHLQSQ